jgi:hypothetical protein
MDPRQRGVMKATPITLLIVILSLAGPIRWVCPHKIECCRSLLAWGKPYVYILTILIGLPHAFGRGHQGTKANRPVFDDRCPPACLLPSSPDDALAAALRWALVPGGCLALGVAAVGNHRFSDLEDIDGAGLTKGTSQIRILRAILQNTLEQGESLARRVATVDPAYTRSPELEAIASLEVRFNAGFIQQTSYAPEYAELLPLPPSFHQPSSRWCAMPAGRR